ncbi:hypothetical protein LTR78_005926 [Recurvomyces mirabilis]|uniref:Cercosporin MFS transporter CTB4 n=1 Tax=Recurvomyces mirabilis TaxID=574656 RepID=A0AAE1C0S9_9PEZI|nr:hypothetical protein LTR78_005926 [Recurvomyces mirabilis]KAK5155264.1 hypothetical protein LTS14_006219 [Recurvomyces mirabilis]
MFAPGVPDVLRDFGTTSETLAAFVVSVYILGYAVGPLLIGPASETYGRYWVYVICNIMFLIFTTAYAVSQNMAQLIVFRFFAGAFGVCPITLGGASICDLIEQEKRGAAMAFNSMGPLLGPVIGPIAGSYFIAAEGWRWTFWVLAIAAGVTTILHAAFCRETHATTLLARQTRRLRQETGNTGLYSRLDDDLPTKQRVLRAIIRPMKMLVLSPIVLLMSLYCAIVYGISYLLYTTFTFVFQENYGFSASNVGLTYVASGIGMFIGLFLIGGLSDRLLKSKAVKQGKGLKPEYRLLPLMYRGSLAPVGLFIYGWTVQYHEQWAVPLFGTLLFGIGILGALVCITQYLIDAFTIHAASAVAANTVLRSIVDGLLPLAGLRMYTALELGWGNSLIAFIALACVPIPFLFYHYGEAIRDRAPVTP